MPEEAHRQESVKESGRRQPSRTARQRSMHGGDAGLGHLRGGFRRVEADLIASVRLGGIEPSVGGGEYLLVSRRPAEAGAADRDGKRTGAAAGRKVHFAYPSAYAFGN